MNKLTLADLADRLQAGPLRGQLATTEQVMPEAEISLMNRVPVVSGQNPYWFTAIAPGDRLLFSDGTVWFIRFYTRADLREIAAEAKLVGHDLHLRSDGADWTGTCLRCGLNARLLRNGIRLIDGNLRCQCDGRPE